MHSEPVRKAKTDREKKHGSLEMCRNRKAETNMQEAEKQKQMSGGHMTLQERGHVAEQERGHLTLQERGHLTLQERWLGTTDPTVGGWINRPYIQLIWVQ